MKRYFSFVITAVLAAAVVWLNLHFRSYPVNFPQLAEHARKAVEQRLRQSAAQAVYKKFPQFDPLAKERLIKNVFSDLKRQNKAAIREQAQQLYLQLKDRYQDEHGQTYLMELDCWHWARYVENVVKLGHPGDETVYGNQLDLLMMAPGGFYIHWDQFLFYLSAFLYKASLAAGRVPLFTFLFYLPLFFAAVFILVLYAFAYQYGRHPAALIATIFVGLSPIFLQRSCAGWFDKDILNLLFPLLIGWLYLRGVCAQAFLLRALLLFGAAFWLGLFSFNWTHWWFILLIVLLYEAFSLASLAFRAAVFKEKNRPAFAQRVSSLALFLFFGAFWVLVLAGHKPLVDLYRQVRLALILNKPLMSSIWPNVYSTVGELRSLRAIEIAQSLGSAWIFLAALLSMCVIMFRAFFSREFSGFQYESIVFLFIWCLSMFFASSRGVRFLVFLLPPLGVSLGWAIHDAYGYFREKKNHWGAFLVVTAFLALNFLFISRASQTCRNIYPLINDTWYKVLTLVREKTPEDTILNSWWDYGDWFKVVGRRRVIFDGQSQDSPQAYWMAKAILSNSEEEAVAILRMLNNGGNRAFEVINEHIKDPLQSVLLLESLLPSKPEEARRALLEVLPVLAADEVMRILFYVPSRACFIVEDSMLPKMPAISYLGNWDFSKVYIAQNFDKQEKERIMERLVKLGRDPRQMQTFYQEGFLISRQNLDAWLSKRLQFYSPLVNGTEKEGVVFFDNGFVYNLAEKTISSAQGQVPLSVFLFEDNTVIEKPLAGANIHLSAVVYKDDKEEGGQYKCILLDRELGKSLLVRLYLFRGKGLRHFQPFIDVEEGNNYIRVFTISW